MNWGELDALGHLTSNVFRRSSFIYFSSTTFPDYSRWCWRFTIGLPLGTRPILTYPKKALHKKKRESPSIFLKHPISGCTVQCFLYFCSPLMSVWGLKPWEFGRLCQAQLESFQELLQCPNPVFQSGQRSLSIAYCPLVFLTWYNSGFIEVFFQGNMNHI